MLETVTNIHHLRHQECDAQQKKKFDYLLHLQSFSIRNDILNLKIGGLISVE